MTNRSGAGANSPCLYDTTMCSTGESAATDTEYFCPGDLPLGAAPSGSGAFCFLSQELCQNATNACGWSHPCSIDFAQCGTGVAAANPLQFWFCDLTIPLGAAPAGSGDWCFDSQADCEGGPNGCDQNGVRCSVDYSFCATGVAGGSPEQRNWACNLDFPAGSSYNSQGLLVFNTLANCSAAPNPCTISDPCTLDTSVAQSGPSSANAAEYSIYCPKAVPTGSSPNGAGAHATHRRRTAARSPPRAALPCGLELRSPHRLLLLRLRAELPGGAKLLRKSIFRRWNAVRAGREDVQHGCGGRQLYLAVSGRSAARRASVGQWAPLLRHGAPPAAARGPPHATRG